MLTQALHASPTLSVRQQESTMKKAALGLGTLLCIAPALAQNTQVTIYGLIDEGVTRVSNIGGSHLTKLDDSVSQGNRLGFRGREDLGDGLEAVFTLEQGFSTDTGALRQGGLGWGRGSFVGVGHRDYGLLTLGRQYDQMTGALIRFHPAFWGGIYGFTPGDADRVSGAWLNNQVTYGSPLIAGFKLSAQVSAAEDGSSPTNAGRAQSVALSYANGPFSAGAAMTQIRGYTVRPGASFGVTRFLGAPVGPGTALLLAKYGTQGFGAGYTVGAVTLSGLTTRSRFENAAGRSEAMTTLGASLAWRAGDLLVLAAGVQRARLEGSAWTTFNAVADYYLSKRTDIYASVNSQKASGEGTVAVLVTNGPSSTDTQTALRVGIRHRF
jgi:outer membrane protein OmpU